MKIINKIALGLLLIIAPIVLIIIYHNSLPINQYYEFKKTIALWIIIIISVAVVIIRIFYEDIKKSLEEILKAIKYYESGDFSYEPKIRSKDEFGVILKNLSNMKDKLGKIYEEIKGNERKYKIALESSNDLVFEIDLEKNHIKTDNERWQGIFGDIPLEDYIDWLDNYVERVHPIYKEKVRLMYRELLLGELDCCELEFQILGKDKKYIWMIKSLISIKNEEGDVIKIVGNLNNIMEKKLKEIKILEDASTDGLTGLLNKLSTEINVKVALANDVKNGALLIMDLDDFKGINDGLGHKFGDEVLKQIGKSLKKIFRADDVVGRIGGDEFLIYMRNIKEREAVVKKGEELRNILMKKFTTALGEFRISGSIGIAIAEKGETYEVLFEKADYAMYYAKDKGKNSYYIYNVEIEEKRRVELDIVNKLKHSEELCNEGLVMRAIRCSTTGNIVGFDGYNLKGLMKYKDLEFYDYISIAEKYKVLTEYNKIYLNTVYKHIQQLELENTPYSQIGAFIVIKTKEYRYILKLIDELEKSYRVNTKNITLHFREESLRMLGEDGKLLIETLKQRGYGIGLFSFGDGNMDYKYIMNCMVNTISLDSSFTRKVLEEDNYKVMFKYLIDHISECDMDFRIYGDESIIKAIKDITDRGFKYYENEFYNFKQCMKLMAESSESMNGERDIDEKF